MRFIGITGGVGAGKSAILTYLEEKSGIRVMLADEIAHELMQPGTECYECIREQFGEEPIYEKDGAFDRMQLAKIIFSDDMKRNRMNAIVHPAVKKYVIEQQEVEASRGQITTLVLEAALLIEEHYDEICDELWYIYTKEDIRRERLKNSRGYSDEKINQIFGSQLNEQDYRDACRIVIDNNGDIGETYLQIEKALRREADE